VINVNEGVRPQALLKFLSRHYVARMFQQNGQNLKRLATEFEPRTALAQFSGPKIHFKGGKAKELGLLECFVHCQVPQVVEV
jgi:hypothetical protein